MVASLARRRMHPLDIGASRLPIIERLNARTAYSCIGSEAESEILPPRDCGNQCPKTLTDASFVPEHRCWAPAVIDEG